MSEPKIPLEQIATSSRKLIPQDVSIDVPTLVDETVLNDKEGFIIKVTKNPLRNPNSNDSTPYSWVKSEALKVISILQTETSLFHVSIFCGRG